ncbi:neo-calmodulin [Octopus bimaculoides]|uniref:neo-calmodulin n=1 Tax=Octopus bimaculoides TaxID=37653 RepID=UPI0022E1B64D|nr:neo-calmodulin [Octopus bimaculoides]
MFHLPQVFSSTSIWAYPQENEEIGTKEAMYIIGEKHGFSKERTRELYDSFSLFDRNGDGVISIDELGTVMMSLGQRPTRDELRALLHSVDMNHSGNIDFGEFLDIFARKLNIDPEKELYEVFCVFDQNKDGFISAMELFEVLSRLGEHITKDEVEVMVKEADLNGDGQVDYNGKQ